MNRDILQGKWQQLKGGVKEQWGKLTDDDIQAANGNFDQLVGKIQERYGYSREESERRMDDFLDRQGRELNRDMPGDIGAGRA